MVFSIGLKKSPAPDEARRSRLARPPIVIKRLCKPGVKVRQRMNQCVTPPNPDARRVSTGLSADPAAIKTTDPTEMPISPYAHQRSILRRLKAWDDSRQAKETTEPMKSKSIGIQISPRSAGKAKRPAFMAFSAASKFAPKAADAIPQTMALGTANSILRKMAPSLRQTVIIPRPSIKGVINNSRPGANHCDILHFFRLEGVVIVFIEIR
jgi:hypothetical protein